jgi:hypothetical protein
MAITSALVPTVLSPVALLVHQQEAGPRYTKRATKLWALQVLTLRSSARCSLGFNDAVQQIDPPTRQWVVSTPIGNTDISLPFDRARSRGVGTIRSHVPQQ